MRKIRHEVMRTYYSFIYPIAWKHSDVLLKKYECSRLWDPATGATGVYRNVHLMHHIIPVEGL